MVPENNEFTYHDLIGRDERGDKHGCGCLYCLKLRTASNGEYPLMSEAIKLP